MPSVTHGLATSRSDTVLDREFLEIRAKLLELASSLDRLDRATGSLQDDSRMLQIKKSLAILSENSESRAERVQLVFSRPYESDWRETFQIYGQKQTQ